MNEESGSSTVEGMNKDATSSGDDEEESSDSSSSSSSSEERKHNERSPVHNRTKQ